VTRGGSGQLFYPKEANRWLVGGGCWQLSQLCIGGRLDGENSILYPPMRSSCRQRDVEAQKPTQQTLGRHFLELRGTLLRMLFVMIPCSAGAFALRGSIARFVEKPLRDIWRTGEGLQAIGVFDSIEVSLQLALVAGILMALPLWFYFAWQFLSPAFKKRERAMAGALGVAGLVLFFSGLTFGFFFLVPVLLSFSAAESFAMGWSAHWTVASYYNFVFYTCLWCGAAFQIPVVIGFLNLAGVAEARQIVAFRPYAITLIFVLAAIVTPTGDIVTLLAAGVPAVLLYELSAGGLFLLDSKVSVQDIPARAKYD